MAFRFIDSNILVVVRQNLSNSTVIKPPVDSEYRILISFALAAESGIRADRTRKHPADHKSVGRFAPERRMGKNVAVLDPDVAQAFPNDDAVNEALRLVLKAAKIPLQQRQMVEEKASYK